MLIHHASTGASQNESKRRGVASSMKGLDIFGIPIPSFNLKGRMSVQTGTGGVVSFIILLIMVLYASLKFIHLIEKENPNVS